MAENYAPLRDFVIDNIQLGKEIGRGANGRILEAKWEGITVAVKQIHSIFMNEVSDPQFQSFRRSFLRECEQSSRLRHPNIVRFFGIYHPPGARVPSLVMERLQCSLTSLLERDADVRMDTKVSIIRDVALGLRYLHSRDPTIIHRDLSSNNVLVSKGMEGKIGDLGTARLVDPNRLSRMTIAPGTVDFMSPEALAAGENVKYERELDVFSFGCVMLHTLSHQWPTPSEPVVTDPVTFEVKGRTEVERRSNYFDKIDRNGKSGALIPLIKGCLNNLPMNRTSIVQICDQLEILVEGEHSSISDSAEPPSQQEIHQGIQIQLEDTVLLKSEDIQITTPTTPPKQVKKSGTDFQKSFKQTWKECADLPEKCLVQCIAELDGRVYVKTSSNRSTDQIYMYDSIKNKWSKLLNPHFSGFGLTTVTISKQLLAIGGEQHDGQPANEVFVWDHKESMWHDAYPKMPTARFNPSCISHGSKVIVAGGVSGWDLTKRHKVIVTNAVEILHINNAHLPDSRWSVVEQLPCPLFGAVPLIVDDTLYIANGYDADGLSTHKVATVSIPELLQSSNKKIGQVWRKLPDMPYSSISINHYQGHLITFSGDRQVRPLHKLFAKKSQLEWKAVPLICIYNPSTKSWQSVGQNPYGYVLGMSVHLSENKFLFLGGVTGTCDPNEDKNLVTTCTILTLTPH